MRPWLIAVLSLSSLAGCRGYLADHVRPEASILGPELTRYGLSSGEAQCLGGRLVERLSVWQLRQLANVTKLIKDPARLTPQELIWVSSHVKDQQVPLQVRQGAEACGLRAGAPSSASVATAAPPAEAPAPAQAPKVADAPSAPAPVQASPAAPAPSASPAPAAARWLNLGSGADKKAISIDASTLQGEMPVRSAWFRIVAPGAAATANSYLLQINCTARTVNPLASRKHDAKGGVTEEVQHGPTGAGANPIQGGSVIEIAYLSLCT
jgi:hypothetical protein